MKKMHFTNQFCNIYSFKIYFLNLIKSYQKNDIFSEKNQLFKLMQEKFLRD